MDPAAADDPVLSAVPERFMALQWHDYACTPAAGIADARARTTRACRPFVSASVAWGTQFHIEVTHQLMLNWWDEGEDAALRGAGYDQPGSARAEGTPRRPRVDRPRHGRRGSRTVAARARPLIPPGQTHRAR